MTNPSNTNGPSGDLKQDVEQAFGSLDAMKEKFNAAAAGKKTCIFYPVEHRRGTTNMVPCLIPLLTHTMSTWHELQSPYATWVWWMPVEKSCFLQLRISQGARISV